MQELRKEYKMKFNLNRTVKVVLMYLLSLVVVAVTQIQTRAEDTDPLLQQKIEQNNFEKKIYDLVQQEKFDELEAIIKDLRMNKSKYEDGTSKVYTFYAGAGKGFDKFSILDKNKHIDMIKKWMNKTPNSITPKIVLAEDYILLAWDYRGSGYAKDVTDEGVKKFSEYLQKAEKILEEANNSEEKDPALCVEWIRFGMGTGGYPKSDFYNLVKKSMEIDPLYFSTYKTCSYVLLPRWYGEKGDVEKFAEWVAEETKEVAGDQMYARVVSAVKGYIGGASFGEVDFSWDRMRKSFEEILAAYPTNFYMLNEFAWFSVYYKDRELAKSLFEKIGDRWNEDSVSTWKGKLAFNQYKQWVVTGQNYPEPEGVFKNGKREGFFYKYFDNGQVQYKWNYKNGEKEGTQSEYYENGNLKHTSDFKAGQYHGYVRMYDINGTITQEWTYDNGEMLGYKRQ